MTRPIAKLLKVTVTFVMLACSLLAPAALALDITQSSRVKTSEIKPLAISGQVTFSSQYSILLSQTGGILEKSEYFPIQLNIEDTMWYLSANMGSQGLEGGLKLGDVGDFNVRLAIAAPDMTRFNETSSLKLLLKKNDLHLAAVYSFSDKSFRLEGDWGLLLAANFGILFKATTELPSRNLSWTSTLEPGVEYRHELSHNLTLLVKLIYTMETVIGPDGNEYTSRLVMPLKLIYTF